MRGPNIWSDRHPKLIILKVDLENLANKTTNQVEGFIDSLQKLLLCTHALSRSAKNECELFYKKIQEGVSFAKLIECLAILLQNLAGMHCKYSHTANNQHPNLFNVIFEYQYESAGIYAGNQAILMLSTLLRHTNYEKVAEDILHLKNILDSNHIGPSTATILNEAIECHIPYSQVTSALYRLGYGENQKFISATLGHSTSCIGVDIAADKNLTKEMLAAEMIPTPHGKIITTLEELYQEIETVGFPLVIKPCFGNHGKGVTTHINTREKAVFAFNQAKIISASLIVEKFMEGFDYRFLLINFKLVAVARRTPPFIIGNGKSTVKALIEEINNDPNRGLLHENYLTKVHIDDMTNLILTENNLTPDSVLPLNKKLFLKYTANMSTGATATDVTDEVHPYNVFLAERIAKITHLDICGIDVIAKNIHQPIRADNGAILEVNAAPGLRMHLSPHVGKCRNVAKPFLDMLYPSGSCSRIPIVAVTGTNGKTTVVRMIEHIVRQNDFSVGMSTTEGIYINKQEIYAGDCSGPRSASVLLHDPTINFAVLECARGGILRSGLAFDHCSVSIVTNIGCDHLGLNDIHSLEDLAKVKAVVPKSTLPSGYAILNADDDLVYAMREGLTCHIGLFALQKNYRITEHAKAGGLCCYLENENMYIEDNKQKIFITHVNAVPLSLNGHSQCMKQNILATTLACWVSHIKLDDIITGLMSFYPTAEHLPGRMNLFKINNCEVLIDYAHNINAYVQLSEFIKNNHAVKKTAVIAGTGDRRDQDIWNTGFYTAQLFDEIIIRHDKDSRGRTNEEIHDLIIQGVYAVDRDKPIKIIPEEFEAVTYAIKHAKPGTLIWYFPDKITNAVNFLQQFIASDSSKIS